MSESANLSEKSRGIDVNIRTIFTAVRCRAFIIVRSAVILGAAIAVTGCATLRGAPTAPFKEEAYVGKDSPLSLTETQLQELIDAKDEATRNSLLRRLLSDIDLRYLRFASGVVDGKNRFEFGKSILTLAASVASSLTPSAGVKANYAGLTALIAGGGAAVDSTFLFNQTSLALVSTMDEQRAAVLAEIRTSMSQSITEYPGQTAFGDAIRYFRVGTLATAALNLQKAAAGRAAEQEQQLRGIEIPTDAQVTQAVQRGQTFVAFVDDKNNIAVLRKALQTVGVAGIGDNTPDDDAVRKAAKDYYRRWGPSGQADDLIAELKKNGFKPN